MAIIDAPTIIACDLSQDVLLKLNLNLRKTNKPIASHEKINNIEIGIDQRGENRYASSPNTILEPPWEIC